MSPQLVVVWPRSAADRPYPAARISAGEFGRFIAGEVGVVGVVHRAVFEPGVPTKPRAEHIAAAFFIWHSGTSAPFEHQLHLEVKLRSDVQPHQLREQEERLAPWPGHPIGQQVLKRRQVERADAQAEARAHIPDAFAGDRVEAELIVAVFVQSRLLRAGNGQPLAAELNDVNWQIERSRR